MAKRKSSAAPAGAPQAPDRKRRKKGTARPEAAPRDAPAEAPAEAAETYPYTVDPLDHAESPGVAYRHIVGVLDAIRARLGKTRQKLRIYDPYYCKGAVKENLAACGFERVYNVKEDFYTAVKPKFDVVVTNPPYSGDHPQKLIDFCVDSGKPVLLLLPNWVYTKPYFKDCGRRFFYIAPRKRYQYLTPKGLRKDDDGKTAPFVTFWYVMGATDEVTSTLYREELRRVQAAGDLEIAEQNTGQAWAAEKAAGGPKPEGGEELAPELRRVYVVDSTSLLPMSMLDQFDPEYKRLRNWKKSQKWREGKNEKGAKGGKAAAGGWGHKTGKKK